MLSDVSRLYVDINARGIGMERRNDSDCQKLAASSGLYLQPNAPLPLQPLTTMDRQLQTIIISTPTFSSLVPFIE